MRNKALIVGSIAYDIIFSIHGDIRNEILVYNGKVDKVNMMFTANGKQKYFGGTAGNIAYGLGSLEQSPYMFSVVGKDFKDDYKKHLEKYNVDLKTIEYKDKYTASYYGISDENYQQIGIWQPDVYGEFIEDVNISEAIKDSELKNVTVACFSPGTGISTRNHMLEVRKKLGHKVKIIFDPSQVLSIFYDKVLLKECLTLADILISNDTEIGQFETIFNMKKEDIFKFGVNTIIETLGADGASVYTSTGKEKIPSVKPKRIVETTGAGDAFRSGLIYGLLTGYDIYKSAKVGTYIGAKSVEEMGGQMYHIEKDEFTGFLSTL